MKPLTLFTFLENRIILKVMIASLFFILAFQGLISDQAQACQSQVTPAAQEAFSACAGKTGASGAKSFIVDADSGQAWISDQSSGQAKVTCYDIQIGGKSAGKPATLKNEEGYTPPGLLKTTPHSSRKKSIGNRCLGLMGTSSGNDRSSDDDRGVLIHEATRATEGCIGVPPGSMDDIKKNLGSNAPVFIWGSKMDPQTACDGKARAPSPGNNANSKGSRR